jgi:hypothetical protein
VHARRRVDADQPRWFGKVISMPKLCGLYRRDDLQA